MLKRTNTVKEAAAEYLQRGWSPIRLKPRSKEPPPGKHSVNTITWKNVDTLRADENLGVQFSVEGALKDLDADYPSAAEFVRELRLHHNTAAFGRAGSVRHLLFNAAGVKAKKFELPEGDYPRPLPVHAGEPSLLVVEIRGADNTYTMVPPSIHPNGEAVAWHGDRREPANLSADELRALAGRIAFAASILYFYPLDASARYDVRMALTGALTRAGMPASDVCAYVQVVARLAGDPKWREDFSERTAQRLQDDEPVTGVPKLVQALQLPAACAATFHDWLGSSDELILDPADPIRSARSFAAAHFTTAEGQPTLYRHRGAFWQYNGACFRFVNDETLRAQLWAFLEKAKRRIKVGEAWALVSFKPNRARVGDALEALGAIRQLDQDINPPAWLTPSSVMPPAEELFACKNGLLHLPTGKLYPPTPDFFNLSASDVGFDRNAPEPVQFFGFLEQLFGKDQQAIRLLQEWHGYALSPDTSQQKILLLIGPKRSGKGTIARVLKGLLGSASVAGPTMTSLAENFGLEPLITKPLAIISDARIGSRTDKSAITERLLSISGEDQMTVARKYLAAWTGQLMTRFMILTNDLLSMNDGSGALPGRFLVLLMIKSFYGKEDLKLTRKLLGELPGILNWSLEGYLRLRKRGHFVQPASSREAVDEIELLAAPVKAFIRDRCKIGTGKEVEHDKLWTAWRAWADGEGRDAGTKAWFGRNLRSAAPGVANKKPGKRGDRRHIYSGITLRGSAKVQAFLAASITNRKK